MSKYIYNNKIQWDSISYDSLLYKHEIKKDEMKDYVYKNMIFNINRNKYLPSKNSPEGFKFATNFYKTYLNAYVNALIKYKKENKEFDYYISFNASDVNGNKLKSSYALHVTPETDISKLFKCFKYYRENQKDFIKENEMIL